MKKIENWLIMLKTKSNIKKVLSFFFFLVVLAVFIYIYVNNYNNKCKDRKCISEYIYGDIKERPNLKDDFYSYVNYEWLKETQLKEGTSNISVFDIIKRDNSEKIKQIFLDLYNNYDNLKEGGDEQKLILFYDMARDFEYRDKQGIEPVKSMLQSIRNISDIKSLNQTLLELYFAHQDFIKVAVGADFSGDKIIIHIDNPDIYLEKSYFQGNDKESVAFQTAYKRYITEVLVLGGNSLVKAESKADMVYLFEKELSEVLLDKDKNYIKSMNNPIYSLSELSRLYPNIDFLSVIKLLELDHTEKINILEPRVLEKLNNMFIDENLPAIKAKLEFSFLKTKGKFLSKDFLEAEARYSSIFRDGNFVDDNESLAYDLTKTVFSDIISRLYIEKHFSVNTKTYVEGLVKDIITTYKNRISNLDWMNESTKINAIKKLDNIGIEIAYPDKWKDYSGIEVKTYSQGGSLFETYVSASIWEYKQSKKFLNKTQDHLMYDAESYTVNASYSPLLNEINLLAGVLQPPFYDINESEEFNLGSIGSIIGHEVSHAFDIQGSQFDLDGNMNNWWSETDKKNYDKKVQQMSDILSSLEVVDGKKLKGDYVVGEAMADLGGLTVVLDIAKQKNLDQKKVIEAFAAIHKQKMTSKYLSFYLENAPYPDPKNRINNTLRLTEEFYKLYNITEKDKMYLKPQDRVKIW